jgi:exosortase/archaeosortase family protein
VSAAALGGDAAAPLPRRAADRHRRRRSQASVLRTGTLALARLVVCLGSIALAAGAIKENVQFRIFEAWLAGHVMPLVSQFRAGAVPGAPIVWFAAGPHRYLALLVTPECTVAILMAPFLLCTAWNIWRQPGIVRPLLALGVAVTLLTLVNQLRLLTIACLVRDMGIGSGFYWGHTLIGSLVTVFGVVLVFLCYAVLLAAGRKKGIRLGRKAVRLGRMAG